MATVSQSIKVSGGGVIDRSNGAGTNVEFTCSSTQYAIVTITNFYLLGGASAANSSILIGGTTVVRLDTSGTGGGNATLVRTTITAVGSTPATATGSPVTLYVGPGQSFTTDMGANAAGSQLQASYVIFQNT